MHRRRRSGRARARGSAGPRTLAAHASSAGSTLARTWVASVGQPAPAAAGSASTSSRWVTAVPERGVRTTSTSGGGASPRESASTVAPARCGLPCTSLVDALGDEQVGERVDGVVERAQLGLDRLALAGWSARAARALPNGIVVSSQRAAARPARQRRRSPSPSATLLARSASDTRGCVRAQRRRAGRARRRRPRPPRRPPRCWSATCCVERRRPASALVCCCAAQRASRFASAARGRLVAGGDLRLELRRSSPGSRRRRSRQARIAGKPPGWWSCSQFAVVLRALRAASSSVSAFACAASYACCAGRDLRRAAPSSVAFAASFCCAQLPERSGAAGCWRSSATLQVVLGGGDRVQRRERPQRRDVAVEHELAVVLVQAALEAVAEQRAERLAGADAVEQREREPHAPRGEVERERRVRAADDGRGARSAARPRSPPARATARGCSRGSPPRRPRGRTSSSTP